MKFMETINKLQAVVTELRREVQKSEVGTAGDDVLHQVPSWYCTCPDEIPCPVHDRNYQDLKGKIGDTFNSNKTAGECICGAHKQIDCPVCSTPDLPLHVRVAKALGKKVFYQTDVEDWQIVNGTALGGIISDYPNDLVAAMGALEEYCEKNDCFLNIYGGSERKWEIQIFDKDTHMAKVSKLSTSFSDAICLAIVAHAEGK